MRRLVVDSYTLIEVSSQLYLFPGRPAEAMLDKLSKKSDWAIVTAARDPWFVGLKGKHDEGDPENLYVLKDKRLYLNWIDAHDAKYFQKEQFKASLRFIAEQIAASKNVLIHCNMGLSRSPSLALLYMACKDILPFEREDAIKEFKKLYEYYEPATGIEQYLTEHWDEFVV